MTLFLNPLSYRDGYQFTWQNGRRLATVSHGNDSISYTYDPDGIRTSKTVNGTTTKYHVMNGTLLGQTKGSDTIVFLYDEKANKYGFDYNGTKYYYIFNVQGDVIGILNQAGTKVVSYQYDAWGKVLSVDGTQAATIGQLNPIRYRGYYYDTETGFYYLQSRYYDPITRRMINADIPEITVFDPSNPQWNKNLFAYCDNNPVMRVDGSGGFWNFVVGAVAGALVGGISSIIGQIASGEEINWGSVAVSAGAGALSGLLVASGVGVVGSVIGNAVISGGESVATQAIEKGSVDFGEAAGHAILGGAMGAVGGKGGTGFAGKHLQSLDSQWTKRVVNTASHQGVKAAVPEMKSATTYYFKSAKKVLPQAVVNEIIIPGARDYAMYRMYDSIYAKAHGWI